MNEEIQLRSARVDPRLFRERLVIDEESRLRLGELMQKWQADDFAALDASWISLAGMGGEARYRRAYLERPRGHSKTTDLACQLAWILQGSRVSLNGVVAAADLDQACLLKKSMERLVRMNGRLCEDLVFRQSEVRNQKTVSRVTFLSSDVRSSWGILPDFVICDELSHWEKPDLWYSLLSSAAKKPNCLMVVLTNAGVGRGWQWDVRSEAAQGASWYFSSLEGCCAEWISKEWLDEQRAMLPESVFERLWNNRWQLSEGGFVTSSEVEACCCEDLREQESGVRWERYFAAIDYAEKHDFTVGVVLHWEGDLLVVDRMDVVVPSPEKSTPIQWVENWMTRIVRDFERVSFVVDEYQLLSLIQEWEGRVELERFAFAGGRGNHALALNLRQLITQGRLKWYAGCGEIEAEGFDRDLEAELCSVVLKQTSGGRCRIDHVADGVHHDDRVFALGAAALKACEVGRGIDWMHVEEPDVREVFDW